VFVVQVDGCKRWEVAGLGALVLEPGDVLYLPRGAEHEAATGDGHSLHLTIGIPASTQRDVMRRMVESLVDDRLDRPLPIGFTRQHGDELRDSLAGSVAAVIEAAGDGDAILEREIERVRTRRKPGAASLTAVVASATVTEASVLVRRPGTEAMLVREPDARGRCLLRIGATTLRLPEHVRPALERALEPGPLSAADLGSLTRSGAIVLLRRLVREGVLDLA
jgi:ribosomal protein L16 Arg81 hydroxylase